MDSIRLPCLTKKSSTDLSDLVIKFSRITSSEKLKIKFYNKLKVQRRRGIPLVMLQRLEQRLAPSYIKELEKHKSLKVMRTEYKPGPKSKKMLFNIVDKKTYEERIKSENKRKDQPDSSIPKPGTIVKEAAKETKFIAAPEAKKYKDNIVKLSQGSPKRNQNGFYKPIKNYSNTDYSTKSLEFTIKHPISKIDAAEIKPKNINSRNRNSVDSNSSDSLKYKTSKYEKDKTYSKHHSHRYRHRNSSSDSQGNNDYQSKGNMEKKSIACGSLLQKPASQVATNASGTDKKSQTGTPSNKCFSSSSKVSSSVDHKLVEADTSSHVAGTSTKVLKRTDSSYKKKKKEPEEDSGIPKIVLYLKGNGPDKQYRCARNFAKSETDTKASINGTKKETIDSGSKTLTSLESDSTKYDLKEESTLTNGFDSNIPSESDEYDIGSLPDLETLTDDELVLDPVEEKLKLLLPSNDVTPYNIKEDPSTSKCSKVSYNKQTGKPTAHIEPYVSEPALRTSSRKGRGFYDESIPFMIEQEFGKSCLDDDKTVQDDESRDESPTQSDATWHFAVENDTDEQNKPQVSSSSERIPFPTEKSIVDSERSCTCSFTASTGECSIHNSKKSLNPNLSKRVNESDNKTEEEIQNILSNQENLKWQQSVCDDDSFSLRLSPDATSHQKSLPKGSPTGMGQRNLSIDSILSLFKVRIDSQSFQHSLKKKSYSMPNLNKMNEDSGTISRTINRSKSFDLRHSEFRGHATSNGFSEEFLSNGNEFFSSSDASDDASPNSICDKDEVDSIAPFDSDYETVWGLETKKSKTKQKKMIAEKRIKRIKLKKGSINASQYSKKQKRKNIEEELPSVNEIILNQRSKYHERDRGRRLAREIPGFNWLEEKIRSGTATPSVKSSAVNEEVIESPVAEPAKEVADSAFTKIVIKPIPALIPSTEFISNSGKRIAENGTKRMTVPIPTSSNSQKLNRISHQLTNQVHCIDKQGLLDKVLGTENSNQKDEYSEPIEKKTEEHSVTENSFKSKKYPNILLTNADKPLHKNGPTNEEPRTMSKYNHLETAVVPTMSTSKALPKKRSYILNGTDNLLKQHDVPVTDSQYKQTSPKKGKPDQLINVKTDDSCPNSELKVHKSNEVPDNGKELTTINENDVKDKVDKETEKTPIDDAIDLNANISVSQKLSILTQAFKSKLNTSLGIPIDVNDQKTISDLENTKSDSTKTIDIDARADEATKRNQSVVLKGPNDEPVEEAEKAVLISIPEPLPSFSSVLKEIKVEDQFQTNIFEPNDKTEIVPSSLVVALYHELLRTRHEVEKLRKVQEQMLNSDRGIKRCCSGSHDAKRHKPSPSVIDISDSDTSGAINSKEQTPSSSTTKSHLPPQPQNPESEQNFVYQFPDNSKRRMSVEEKLASPKKRTKSCNDVKETSIAIQYDMPEESKSNKIILGNNAKLRDLLGISNNELDIVPIDEIANNQTTEGVNSEYLNNYNMADNIKHKERDREIILNQLIENQIPLHMQAKPTVTDLPNLIPSNNPSSIVRRFSDSSERNKHPKVTVAQQSSLQPAHSKLYESRPVSYEHVYKNHKIDMISVSEPKSLINHHVIPILPQNQGNYESHATKIQAQPTLAVRKQAMVQLGKEIQAAMTQRNESSSSVNKSLTPSVHTFQPKILIPPITKEHSGEWHQPSQSFVASEPRVMASLSEASPTNSAAYVAARNAFVCSQKYANHQANAQRHASELYSLSPKSLPSPPNKIQKPFNAMQQQETMTRNLNQTVLTGPANMRYSSHPAYHQSQSQSPLASHSQQTQAQLNQQHYTQLVQQQQSREIHESMPFHPSQQRPALPPRTSPPNPPPYNNGLRHAIISNRISPPNPQHNMNHPQQGLRNLHAQYPIPSPPKSIQNNPNSFKVVLPQRMHQQMPLANNFSHPVAPNNQAMMNSKVQLVNNESVTQITQQVMPAERSRPNNQEQDAKKIAQERNRKKCLICPKPAQFLCSGCKTAWYCSKECQRDHWGSHSPTCASKGDRGI